MTADRIEISGFTAPGFERVRETFLANFAAGEELGARFSAFREGEAVIDIFAGWSDRDRTIPFTDDTLACLFSSGKAAMATLIAMAVSAGKLDYERPVAADWPAFGASGKERVTLAMTLSHQAGLCGFPDEMPPEDWLDHEKISARLAAMAPLWPPGSASGYHPQTVGYIANELMRRRAGLTIGEALRERALDIHCGMKADEIARAAFMPKPPSAPIHRKGNRFTEIAFLKPWSAAAKVSREDWMAAEIPASNMHGTARALAEIAHPLANGGVDAKGARVIEQDVVAAALAPRVSGDDLVLPFHLTWAAGLMANTNGHFGPNDSAFGHAGFGGSCAMVDPEKRVSAAYVMNRMSPSLAGDPRAVRLLTALDDCL
ncbi:MAG: serine hydrolase domain-containing protein [Pseudomonadota bacterium]